jgi:hypothetical protein
MFVEYFAVQRTCGNVKVSDRPSDPFLEGGEEANPDPPFWLAHED